MFDTLVPVCTFAFGFTLAVAVRTHDRGRRIEYGLWAVAALSTAIVLTWIG